MAEPVGMASGVLALAVFAFQSSKGLHEVFSSFQNHGRRIEQVMTELTALNDVLESLRSTLESDPEGMDCLKLPLLHCGKACQECERIVKTCTTHSNGLRTSIRDWLKFNFMGKDLNGFTALVSGYKATIMVALGDANLRTSKVTVELLRQYKAMISSTTFDLEEILQDLDTTMHDPTYQQAAAAGVDGPANKLALAVNEERESIQQCLKICMDMSQHIDQVQAKSLSHAPRQRVAIEATAVPLPPLPPPPPPPSSSSTLEASTARRSGGNGGGGGGGGGGSNSRRASPSPAPPAPADIPRLITNKSLTDCRRGIGYTTVQLRARLQDLNRQIAVINSANTSTAGAGAGYYPNAEEMQEVAESLKQCLNICGEAAEQASAERVNVFEDVEMADDGHQLILSTVGDLISAKRITVGSRSAQWLGQISDESLQQLSKDRGVRPVSQVEVERGGTHFENRHGIGRKVGLGGVGGSV